MEREEYLKAGDVHTKDDVEIDEKELKQIERKVNATVSLFVKKFKVGEGAEQVERHRSKCRVEQHAI